MQSVYVQYSIYRNKKVSSSLSFAAAILSSITYIWSVLVVHHSHFSFFLLIPLSISRAPTLVIYMTCIWQSYVVACLDRTIVDSVYEISVALPLLTTGIAWVSNILLSAWKSTSSRTTAVSPSHWGKSYTKCNEWFKPSSVRGVAFPCMTQQQTDLLICCCYQRANEQDSMNCWAPN